MIKDLGLVNENEQISIFDLEPEQAERATSGILTVVRAKYISTEKMNWQELFSGYDELYGITYSSGIGFMEKVFDRFEYVEMIFGCEGVMNDDIAAIMSTEIKTVELLAKSKSAKRMAERIENDTMKLYVSRDTNSHEKEFILKAKDGRTRVITGSANMSASAFCGYQRETIRCFDDIGAYEDSKNRFEEFKQICTDNVSQKVLLAQLEDEDYIRDNVEEIPIIKTIEKKNIVIIEPSLNKDDDIEILADIKGLEKEIKPMIPKPSKSDGKVVLTGEYIKSFARKYKEHVGIKKVKEKRLPKLHIDYDGRLISFNGKEQEINPSIEDIKTDIKCIDSYMSSPSSFYGDWKQSQRDYYAFMNWYFASLFMPYLRYVASKNNYDMTPFPVFGIIYGDSNGGKSTFIKLLSKLMCGVKVPLNNSSDFTSGNIEALKRACEGLPINIDDLAKAQYDAHYEKIIKDDNWGIADAFINYPSVAISTNKIASLKPDITKRTVTCHISTVLNKEDGAKNSKKINESMKQASNSMYMEYVRRMFDLIENMVDEMKSGDEEYFPDVFSISSYVIKSIYSDYMEEIPEYVTELNYSDYFGDKAIGKNAMKKIVKAWEVDKKGFSIDKKKNMLTYTYADSSRTYELRYIQQELPPVLNAIVVGSSIVMDLDKAKQVFEMEFKRGFFG
ncbi:MAG: hypothetical protein Q4D29_04210 [Lachnospiraceae bacterium]|nr:hypothetical protein [Lachnospiraceae bacterium]